MAKHILAIGTLTCFDRATNDIIMTSKSLTTAGLDLGLTMEEIRGGIQNPIQGYLPHTSSMKLSMEDALFDLNYIDMNCNGGITASADVMTTETITTVTANTITVTNTPVSMSGNTAIVGWYKLASDTTETWTTITFSGKNGTATGLASGSTVCVKYFYTNTAGRKLTVNSAFIPKIVRAVITYTLYASSQSGTTTSNAKIGELQIEVPQMQFVGAQSFSISSSGASTSPLEANALVNYNGDCSGNGYYALIKEIITGADPFSNCKAIGVADGDITLAVAGTETIKVYAFYSDGTQPSLISNSLLTFTSATPATATVGANTGLVTGVATGTSTITIIVTGKATLSTKAVATVS